MDDGFQIFEHKKFGKIRVVVIDGVIWFIGKDVAVALGYSSTKDALARHVETEDKKIVDLNRVAKLDPIADAISRGWIKNEVTVINESGLYALILSSKLPEAKKFKHWVTSEVLPSIRETGSYSLPNVQAAVAVQNQQPVLKSAILANALKNAASIKQILEEKFNIKDGISSAVAISMVEKSDGVELSELKLLLPAATHEIGRFTPTQIAQKLGLKSAQVVNQLLIEFGLQEKDGNTYILTNEGKKYGEIIPFSNNKNEHSGYRIKWSAAVFSFFEEKGYTLK